MNKKTLYDRLRERALNNKLIASVGIVMAFIIFLSSFWLAMKSFFPQEEVRPTITNNNNNIYNEVRVIDTIYQKRKNHKDKKARIKKKFSLDNKLSNHLKKEHTDLISIQSGFKFSDNFTPNQVAISFSGELEQLQGRNLYRYNGGALEILINNSSCTVLQYTTIDPTFVDGNSKSFVLNKIERDIKREIQKHKNQIIQTIAKCLKQ